jgi:cytochrome c biogenesis protein CcdA
VALCATDFKRGKEMSTINLLILFGIICFYFTIGAGVYIFILWHDKAEWKESEAGVIMMVWPLVFILLLPCAIVEVCHWLWMILKARKEISNDVNN